MVLLTENLDLLTAIILSYLFGSVPFGLVITRAAGLGDIRNIGSGNIGATNVLRTGRRDLAAATLILDAAKGGIAALLTGLIVGPFYAPIAGAAAFTGHCFPLYLKFKGGKGVATFFGTLLAINPYSMLFTSMAWLGSALLFRFSSLSGIIAAAAAPFITATQLQGKSGWVSVSFMSLIIILRHKDNIKRLINGSEPKIGSKK